MGQMPIPIPIPYSSNAINQSVAEPSGFTTIIAFVIVVWISIIIFYMMKLGLEDR